jgi:hypothetical protein
VNKKAQKKPPKKLTTAGFLLMDNFSYKASKSAVINGSLFV